MVQFLLESISDAVWLIDPDTGAVVDCNDATVDLLCCTSRADLIGKRFEDLAAPEQKVGAPNVEPDLPIAERFSSRGSTFNWRVRRFDGTEVILEASATAIARDGEPIIVLVSRLPGKRKEVKHALADSEERFRSFFERNADAMALLDPETLRFIEVNEAGARLLGAPGPKILRDVLLTDWCPERQPDGRLSGEKDREMIRLALTNASHRFEWLARRYDGSPLPLDIVMSAVPFGARTVLSMVARDISRHKSAEDEISQLRTLAREKELGQLRSHFVSIVSHEFRTPLGIIQSSAEILEDYLDQLHPGERKEHLQSIRQNTDRMARLMEEALLIGGLDEGKIEFKPGPLELRSFVEKLVDDVLSVTNRRCPIELSLAEAPGEIQADERLLQHICTNLLTNGVKYSDPGQAVRLEIKCVGKEIICAIRDQGKGIPEGDREWLFSAFHRGQNVVDRPGTRLGLVIVKRCVELHGGKIEVESQFGKGTVVTVRLPLSCP